MQKKQYFETILQFYENVFHNLDIGMSLDQAIESAKDDFWSNDSFTNLVIGIAYFKLKFYGNRNYTHQDIEWYKELKKNTLVFGPDLNNSESEHLEESICNLDAWMFSS